MQIELRKIAGNLNRGARHIVVDGAVWGEIVPNFRGPSGVEYWFRQQGRGRSELIMNAEHRAVSVFSDNIYRRRTARPSFEPLQDRLLDQVRGLIADRKLIHPDELKRIQDEQKRALNVRREAAAVREGKAFEKRAREAIRAAAGNPDHLVVEIVEAMRWAQTK